MARPNGPRLLKVLAVGAGGAASLVAALSSAAPALAVGRLSAGPASLPSCSIVPASTVKWLLGEAAQPPVETHPVPSGTTCTYAVGSNSLGVQITFLQVTLPAFEAVEQDYLRSGAIKISGIGQAAFAVGPRNNTYQNLFLYGAGYNMGITAEAPLPKLENLAKAVLARLQ